MCVHIPVLQCTLTQSTDDTGSPEYSPIPLFGQLFLPCQQTMVHGARSVLVYDGAATRITCGGRERGWGASERVSEQASELHRVV